MAEKRPEPGGDAGSEQLGDADNKPAEERAPEIPEPAKDHGLERIKKAVGAGRRRKWRANCVQHCCKCNRCHDEAGHNRKEVLIVDTDKSSGRWIIGDS